MVNASKMGMSTQAGGRSVAIVYFFVFLQRIYYALPDPSPRLSHSYQLLPTTYFTHVAPPQTSTDHVFSMSMVGICLAALESARLARAVTRMSPPPPVPEELVQQREPMLEFIS